MQLDVLNLSFRIPTAALLRIFAGFFIVSLEVGCYHAQKHEGTNAALFGFVKVTTFSEETFQHEVKRSEFGKLDLHRKYSNDPFVAVVSVESYISK